MTEDEEIPEDLGLKFGTKAESFWTRAKEKLEAEVEQAKYEIQINNHVIKFAEKQIKKEQQKHSSNA